MQSNPNPKPLYEENTMRYKSSLLAMSLAVAVGAAGPVQADNLVELIRKEGNFSMFLEALESTGMMETLTSQGPFTLLAPSDEAFQKLNPNALKIMFQYSYKEELAELLQYHVIPGEYTKEDIQQFGDSLETMLGEPILVSATDDLLLNEEAKVTSSNRLADNGIVHVIDTLVFPE
jgi:uncharacterized surface protein with fasciclin (FAS1) repeats